MYDWFNIAYSNRVKNIAPTSFKASEPTKEAISNPIAETKTYKTEKLEHVTPDFNIKLPQKYTKIGTTELNNGLKLHSYKLANGHRISIVPMENSPCVVKNYVNVGSMNETDDIKGISHFLEHMAFNGTNGTEGYLKLNQGDSFKKIENLGGWINASTNYAVTDYVNSTPLLEEKDLETQLKVIASMTEDLALTDEMIEKEKGPVCSEINMILDNPQTILMDQTVRSLFNIKSSADELVGGSVQHIQNLNREKVKAYYDKYYTPTNMNLVITGDVDPEDVINKVAKLFKSTKVQQGQAYEEKINPIKKTIRKDFVSDKATSTEVMLGFAGPKSNDTKSKVVLDVLCKYINSTEAGLSKELKKFNAYADMGQEKISTNPNNPTMLYYAFSCSDEKSEEALKAVFNKLANIKKPSIAKLENIKAGLLQNYNNRFEFSSRVNNTIGNSILEQDFNYLTDYKDILKNITPEDIEEAIDKYFNIEKAAITLVHPDKKVKADKNVSFKGKSPLPMNLSKISTQTLANNYEAGFHETNNENIYFNVNLYFDPRDKSINPAAREVLYEIYSMGTKELNEDEFQAFEEKNNLNVSTFVSENNLSIIGYSNKDNFEKALGKANEILRTPRITQETMDEAISRLKDGLARSKDSSTGLYIDNEAEHNPLYTKKQDIIDGLDKLTLKDLQDLHNKILASSDGSIAINIPKSSPEFKKVAIDNLNKLPSVKPYKKKEYDVYKANTAPVVITKDRSVSQADIMQTYKFPVSNDPKEIAIANILNTLLSSSSTIGLFNTLREKEHLAYSVYSSFDKIGNCGELSCNILTTTDNKELGETPYDNLQKSINGFHRQINCLINSEYSDDDLESAKRGLKASLLHKEGVPSKLDSVTIGLTSSYGLDKENQMYKAIDSITRDDIRKMAEKIFKNQPIYTIVASKDTLEANKDYLENLKIA